MLEKLCLLNGASGDENAVRDFIIKKSKITVNIMLMHWVRLLL